MKEYITKDTIEEYRKTTPITFGPIGEDVYKRCVTIDTPVLCSDLTWRQAGELNEGDELLAFDEFCPGGRGNSRKLRIAKVTHNKIEKAKCLGIELENEEVLYCTPDHMWLVQIGKDSQLMWIKAKDLLNNPNANNMTLPKSFDVWTTEDSYEAGYLAGALDGEGSHDRGSLVFTQVSNGMLTKVEQILDKLNISFKKKIKQNKSTKLYKSPRQQCFDLDLVGGLRTSIELLGKVGSVRLKNKFMTWLSDKSPAMRSLNSIHLKVVRVFDAGEREIAVLSTSEKTHFTAGFPSHNTYSRTKRDGKQEDWYETAARVVNGNCNYVPEDFIEKDEADKLFKLILNMEILPAGRHLWATGIGSFKDYIVNCFASDFTPRFSEHFEFTFMRLMEGGGVGSNYSALFINSRDGTKSWQPKSKINLHLVCQPGHKDYDTDVQISKGEDKQFGIKAFKNDGDEWNDYIKFTQLLSQKYSCDWDPGISNGQGTLYIRVADSREGWAEALVRLLDAHMLEGNERDIVIDVSNVRPRGALLKGFGGRASGPDALMLLMLRVNLLLNDNINQNLMSMHYMLIDHYIAQAVVSGGVRRSARMSMKYWKDPDIFDFIDCKQTRAGEVPLHWTTNISVVIDNKFNRALKRGDSHAEAVYGAIVEGAKSNGEPGIINASKALEGEAPGTVFFTTNPCGEIGFVRYPDLLCFDVCNLGHANLDRVSNPEEAFRLLTRFLIRASFAPVMDEKQRKNIDRNRRIGVGLLGYHSWLVKNKVKYSDAPSNENVKAFFRRMYKAIDATAKEYASQLRIPEPIKKTTIAPTGTIGNLAGCTTGCQSVFSKFYIRRMRLSNTDPLIKELKGKGYNIIPDVYAANTSVVEYYCVDPIYDQVVEILKKEYMSNGEHEAKAIGLAQQDAVELIEDQGEISLDDVLATQRMLQKEFVDNAISITVNVDASKISADEIKNTLRHYLPDLKGVTIFPEVSMPLTPLERLTWEELMEHEIAGRPIERSQAEMTCANGSCPIK